MASTGKFYPFDRYINDISLTLDASHKIVPSRYIAIKTLIDKAPIEHDEPFEPNDNTDGLDGLTPSGTRGGGIGADIGDPVDGGGSFNGDPSIQQGGDDSGSGSDQGGNKETDGDNNEPSASDDNGGTPSSGHAGEYGPTDMEHESTLLYWSWPSDVVNAINNACKLEGVTSIEDIDYAACRKRVFDLLEDKIECNDVVTEDAKTTKYYVGGDINFLSHDVYDGMIYSEIYLHISNEAGLSRYLINNTNQAQNERVIEQASINVNTLPNNDKFSFQAVLVFYDIYKSGSEDPYACDIPLGIYILMDESRNIISQELLVQSDELFGSGTSWSTRICSRFVSSATIGQNPKIGTTASDYSTMTRVLQEVGKAIETMEKNITSREEDMQNIKIYLDNFKNQQTINVPYILGDWWYVNGRPVSKPNGLTIESQDEMNRRITRLESFHADGYAEPVVDGE